MTRFIFLLFVLAGGGIIFFFLSPSSQQESEERIIEKKTEEPKKPSRELPKEKAQEEQKKSITAKEETTKSEKETTNELQTIQAAIDALKMSLKTFSESQSMGSPPPPLPKARLPQAEIHRIASQSVVNLLCQEEGGAIAIATGSIVHSAGYILTNAHIVDNANKEQECTVRKGSPAVPFAIAKLVFAPSAFSATTSITEQIKWDMALWKIEKPLPGASSLPESFDPVESRSSSTGFDALTIDILHEFFPQEALATFSYPAELLSKEVILSSLYLVFSETAVEGVDEFFIQSLAGLGSQQGSSGGALLDPATGKFVGLIFAIDKETEINKRRLFALRASRIDEIMKQETGKTLEEYLAQ